MNPNPYDANPLAPSTNSLMNRTIPNARPWLSLASVLAAAAVCTAHGQSVSAVQNTNSPDGASARNRVPDLRELVSSFRTNEMRTVAQRYQADRGNLNRYYNVTLSPAYFDRVKWFCTDWLAALQKICLLPCEEYTDLKKKIAEYRG